MVFHLIDGNDIEDGCYCPQPCHVIKFGFEYSSASLSSVGVGQSLRDHGAKVYTLQNHAALVKERMEPDIFLRVITLLTTIQKSYVGKYIDGLVQERRNSSALAMELRLYCTNPLIKCIEFRKSIVFLNYCNPHPWGIRSLFHQTSVLFFRIIN